MPFFADTILIEDDIIYAMDQGHPGIGSLGSAIHALNAGDGSHRWSVDPEASGSGFGRVVGADENGVYFLQEEPLQVIAYRPRDGSVAWTWTPKRPFELESGPPRMLVHDGSIIVAVSDEDLLSTVVSLDTASGSRQWIYQDPNEFGCRINSLAASDTSVFVFSSGTWQILDRDGRQRRKEPLGAGQCVTGTSVALGPSRVIHTVLATGGFGLKFVSPDLSTTSKIDVGSSTGDPTLCLTEDTVFISHGWNASDSEVVALAYDGEIERRQQGQDYVVAVDRDFVYAVRSSGENTIRALDHGLGTVHWEYQSKAQIGKRVLAKSLTPARNRLYLGGGGIDSGRVVALE